MWGAAVESESNNGNSGSAAWGSPVTGGSAQSDATSWMNAGGASTGWGSGVGGNQSGSTTQSKSGGGWDAQQPQSNLVASSNPGSQNSGNSWSTTPNGVAPVNNGWTGGNNSGQTNWNTGSGNQWTGTSPGSGSTWAGVAGRLASTTSAAPQPPNQQQGSISTTGPVITTPTAAAVRPKTSTGGFDNPGQGAGWGKPIDQGTPWDVRQGNDGNTNTNTNTFGAGGGSGGGNSGPAPNQASQWSGNNNGGGGGGGNGPSWNATNNQHSGPGGNNMNREGGWQNPSDNRDTTPSFGGNTGGGYVGGNGGKPARSGNEWSGNGGGSTSGGNGWDSLPPQSHRSNSNSNSNNGMWGQDGQREPAGNVWTGPPPPADVADSHMIWTNPYPKKTAQPDKGTTTWGDPTIQGEIKRWKTNNEGDMLPALSAVQQAGASSNAQPAGNVNSGISQAQQQQQSASTANWTDSTASQQQQQQQPPKTPTWTTGGNGNGGAGDGSSPTSGGWGNDQIPNTQKQPTPENNPKPNVTYDRSGIDTAGWGKPEPSRNSMDSDAGNVSDEVFSSNPTTPLSAGAGTLGSGQPGSTMILNKQQQQNGPNGFGGHLNAGNNLNQLINQKQNSSLTGFNANNSMSGNTGGRLPQQQQLTAQIADQLKAAVRAGLIDMSILHQPLPQDTLLRLNQLLQCVPKLEQAQKEMMQLQTQQAQQPGGLNPAQAQELQRISKEVTHLRQTMTNLKQAINSQTQNFNQQGGRNGQTGNTGGDSGQSKLEQWKRGSTNGVMNGSDSGNGAGVFGVGLSGNANDPWSNTPAKRNSGADWPQSPATTPGDMPKSPDKNELGKGENGDIPNRMSTPLSQGESGQSLDDVPEFTPGKLWNWKDPKELAEDPDATPGSVKRPTLSSVNSVVNPSDFFNSATSPSGGGHFGSNSASDSMGPGGLAASMSAMTFGGNNSAMGGNSVYPGFGQSSGFYNQSKGGNGGYDPSKMSNSGGFGGQGGLGDSWGPGGMPRANRPPSQLGKPVGRQFNHSMSTPATTGAGFMPPYGMGNAPQWVVLTNLNMMDEPTLQMMMSRIAPISSCLYPPGAGFAVVKFKDVSLDKVLARLQHECSQVGITIQLAKDDEVSRLIHAVTGQRGGGPQNAGHLFGPPPPPPPPPHHHPNAMGPAIWDGPPPATAGPWGPPPPPAAAGLHHAGPSGPFAPHHAPFADAATAMSMTMPPGMHDGLFAPVGHDRHAPF